MTQSDLSRSLNVNLVERFQMTRVMYENAKEDDLQALSLQREKDWADWYSLNSESKAFLRAQLGFGAHD